jgi:hypothetical protein
VGRRYRRRFAWHSKNGVVAGDVFLVLAHRHFLRVLLKIPRRTCISVTTYPGPLAVPVMTNLFLKDFLQGRDFVTVFESPYRPLQPFLKQLNVYLRDNRKSKMTTQNGKLCVSFPRQPTSHSVLE